MHGCGVTSYAALMHNKTHHGMVHWIKSHHGLLHLYSGTDKDKLKGMGQGSGASPVICLIYSASMLAAFCAFTPGIHTTSPFETNIIRIILAVFYIDDHMPRVNDVQEKSALPLEVLLKQAGKASQSWE
jgi:hypothetical protein